MAAAMGRDTDADWRRLGETDPYFGVLTDPRYRTDALEAATLEAFYESGRAEVSGLVEAIARVSGEPPRGCALDFGCGVGRLAEPMTAYADSVVGYDIAPGMLEKARARGGRATYSNTLPDGPFDWINSHIVLQHIPPERGLAMVEQLVRRLALNGVFSLHLTFSRDRMAGDPPPPRTWLGRLRRDRWFAARPAGYIAMFDYDLNAVFDVLWERGARRFGLEPVHHHIHRGFCIIGRRTALL